MSVPEPATSQEAAFTLPVNRSWNPTQLGHSAGVFQMGASRLRSDIEVHTFVGAVASARGAPLGSREFDVFTQLTQLFLERINAAGRTAHQEALDAGATEDEAAARAHAARVDAAQDRWVEGTIYRLARRIYGGESRERYEMIGRSLQHLKAVTVTLPGFDAATGGFNANTLSQVNIVSKVVITDQRRRIAEAKDATRHDLARICGSAKGTITLKVELDDWICHAVLNSLGHNLNLDVQRELAGAAKTLWVLLEALAFEPVADAPDLERYVLRMDERTFRSLGLNCRRFSDNVGKVKDRLTRILDTDPAYVEFVVCRDERDRRRVNAIEVVRSTGAMRQQRLRRQLRQQLDGSADRKLEAA